jgi:hypothetical protein
VLFKLVNNFIYDSRVYTELLAQNLLAGANIYINNSGTALSQQLQHYRQLAKQPV